jgi:hypothetical protein
VNDIRSRRVEVRVLALWLALPFFFFFFLRLLFDGEVTFID